MSLTILSDVRAVLFDVYGTLVEISNPVRPYRRLIQMAIDQGKPGVEVAATAFMTQRLTLRQAAQWLDLSLSESQARGLEHDLVDELGRVRLFAEVSMVLNSLRKRGFRLGVCSNLAVPYLAPAKRLLGPYVDVEVWSCEAGKVKPDPEIYHLATRELGVPTTTVLMVGDTYRTDVAGPLAIGMRAQQVDRERLGGSSWSTLKPLLDASRARVE